MKRLLVLVLVLVVLLAIADVGARSWVESKVETAAEERLPEGVTAQASVSSFPFLARLAATGKVQEFTLDLYDIESDPIDVFRLRLEMHDLRFDRSSLWDDPRITGVGFVALRAYITEDAIREATGADVRIFEDGITVTIGGNTSDVIRELAEDGLTLSFGSSFLETIPLPGLDVVPCKVEYELQDGKIVFSCRTNQVPQILVDAIGSQGLKELLD